jgi:hypothetical protein
MMAFEDYPFVEGVVGTSSDVKTGMYLLIDYFEKRLPDPVWTVIRGFDFDSDISKLRSWLEKVLSTEPPSKKIKAYWFGLFNPVLEDGKPGCALYISGSTQFDPNDDTGEWAVWGDDSYLPQNRYVSSEILHNIYRCNPGNDRISGIVINLLILGYSSLVVKEIIHAINPKLLLGKSKRRDIAVGFDSGDFITLEGIER